MPNKSITKIIFTLLIFFLVFDMIGQSYKNTKNCGTKDWQFNYNLGFTEFYGDASTNSYFQKFSGEIIFATGGTVRKFFSPAFGLGLNLWYSGTKSKKNKLASGVPTDIYLKGNYFDGNIHLHVDFSNLFWGLNNRKVSIYGILGIGYSSWNTTLTDSITGNIINSGDTIGSGYYKKGAVVIPFALGLNYMLGNNWALNFEMNLRTVISDDVDMWRDGFKYDQLLYTSIGVSYFINKKARSKRKRVQRDGPVKPVLPYNYLQNTNERSSSETKASPGVILIDAPIQKKIEIPSGIIYRVQVFATRNKMASFNYLRERFNITGDIYENHHNGIYRYSTGSNSTYHEALNNSYIMKNKGVSDAFVVAYKADIRILITPEMKKQ